MCIKLHNTDVMHAYLGSGAWMRVEAEAQSLDVAAAAAKHLKAVEQAGSHQECIEALQELRLLCTLHSSAEDAAGLFWFQSLQHLIQAAPVTIGEVHRDSHARRCLSYDQHLSCFRCNVLMQVKPVQYPAHAILVPAVGN